MTSLFTILRKHLAVIINLLHILYNICATAVMSCRCLKCLQTMRLQRNAVTDYCKLHGKETGTYSSANPDWNHSQHTASFINRSFFSIHKLSVPVCVSVCAVYLQLNINTHILAGAWVVE